MRTLRRRRDISDTEVGGHFLVSSSLAKAHIWLNWLSPALNDESDSTLFSYRTGGTSCVSLARQSADRYSTVRAAAKTGPETC
ncbi:hypothetical protein VTI28DRAFT_10041 [Corynascus sepedonium]